MRFKAKFMKSEKMKEEVIFRLPGISLKQLNTNDDAPLAFNDIQPMNIINETLTTCDSFKEQQNYVIQRDDILIDNTVKDIMIQYQYCNQTREWPKATNYHCYWCCHSFTTIPCFIPMSYKNDIYKVYGNFCSFNCALSFNYYSNHVNYGERSALIQDLYYRIYGFDAPKLTFAPDKQCLELFGGSVSIEDYRASFTSINDYKLTFPNIVFIIPQLMEEKRMNFIKKPVELPKTAIKPITKVNSATSLVTTMGILKK